MANPTTNFGWVMPTSTDLVTDLPADFAVFGQAVDTSMADLKGGTTGQILAKATNTDMDFTWVTNDVGDITAVTAGTGISGGGTSGAVTITNDMATTITASGDIVVGTGSGTYDNLPIGTTGQILTADTTVSPYKVKWATPAASGGMTELATGSLTSGTTISLTSISGSYKTIELWGYGINCAADFTLTYRLNNDSGTSYRFSGSFGTSSTGTANSTTSYLGEPFDAAGSVTFRISIPNYAAASTYKNINSWALGAHPTTANDLSTVNTILNLFYNTAAITRIDVTSTQTFSSGTYKLYGVN